MKVCTIVTLTICKFLSLPISAGNVSKSLSPRYKARNESEIKNRKRIQMINLQFFSRDGFHITKPKNQKHDLEF